MAVDFLTEIEGASDLSVFKVAVVFSKGMPREEIRDLIAQSLRDQADRIERGEMEIPDYSLNNGGR